MEGGSKTSVNLEAGLDVSTSDMLVNVNQPTFQHNWQKYQGKFLPNSLRYEQNGWAAGWNVYSFDYSSVRVQAGNRFVSRNKLNDNPTYILSLYDTETSSDVLHTVCYNRDLKVINVDKGTAEADGNDIKGAFDSNSWTIEWDELTRKAQFVTDDDLSMEMSLNNDYTTRFVITDNKTSLSVDMDVRVPSQLSGDKLKPQPFDGAEGSVSSWNDFIYDANSNTLTLPDGSVTVPVVSDVNKIEFDYDETVDESYLVTLDLKEKVTRFDNCKISPSEQNKDMLLEGTASKLMKFDKFSGNVLPTSLVAEDAEGIIVQAQIAAWLSVSISIGDIDAGDVKKPDNIQDGNVMVYAESPGQKAKATSTFGPEQETTLSGTGWQAVQMPARYARIYLTNGIRKGARWQPYKYRVNDKAWCFSSRRFSDLTNNKENMSKLLGNLYTIGDCQYDYTDVFDYNDVWDSIVHSRQDISDIRSVKLKTASAIADTIDDNTYVQNNNPVTSQDLLDEVCKITGTFSAYNAGQASITTAGAYVNGEYVGGTYEDVGVVLASDGTFWPFRYVPCFNLTGVGKCYYADGTRTITSLADYKNFILGTYMASLPLGSEVILQQDYSRTREVVNYKENTDFEHVDINEDQDKYQAFDDLWNEWYPAETNPCAMPLSVSSDSTYGDYDDIEFVQEQVKVKYIPPAVKLDENHWIFTCNKFGLMLYDNVPANPEVTWKVFHHTVDKSDLYETVWKWRRNDTTFDFSGDGYDRPATGYTPARLRIDSNDYDLTFLMKGASSAFSAVGYNKPNLADATYRVTSSRFSSSASYISCTIQAKDKSRGSEAWAEEIYWNTPFYDVFSCYVGSSVNPPATPSSSDYAKHTHVDYIRTGILLNSALRDDTIDKTYTKKTSFGAVLAVPLKASVAERVRYPEVKTVEQFSTEPYTTIVLEPVPDTDSRVDKTESIWLDRPGGKCLDLFELSSLENKPLDTGSTTSGHMMFALTSKDSEYGWLFWAKKAYNSQQQEITKDFYCPGIAYDHDDFSNDMGNMSAGSESLGTFLVNWNPTVHTCPVNAYVKFSRNNNPDYIGYNDIAGELEGAAIEIGKDDFVNLETPLTITVGDTKYELAWHMLLQTTVAAKEDFDVVDANVSAGPVLSVGAEVTVPLAIKLEYKNNTARFAKLSEGYELVSVSNDGKIVVVKEGRQFTYNYITQQLSPSRNLRVDIGDTFQHVSDDIAVTQQVTAVMPAVYDGEKDGDIVRFEYAGNEYEVDLKEFDKARDTVSVFSTDVRKPGKTKLIGSLDPQEEYQLVKQQWNSTVEVENFWWVNSNHILELDNYNFTLKRKTSEVDDWNGDRWEKIYEIPRANVLKPSMIRWFACSVYGSDSNSLFMTLEASDDKTVKCVVYDIIKEMSVKFEIMLQLNQRAIGQKLNDKFPSGSTGFFNTYNVLSAPTLLSQGRWSDTIVDGRLLLGCSLSKNYDQWTAVIDIDSGRVERVVQGYGCVGLNGCLTGGQIPSDFFSESFGFNGTVMPVSHLTDKDGDGSLDSSDLDSKFVIRDLSVLNKVDECVVGTAEQQWYVKKTLCGIVSHLEYEAGGSFVKKVIPLTNNFCAAYKSPSFANVMLGDLCVQVQPFNKIMTLGDAQGVWNTLMGFAGWPMLYYFAPRRSSLAYLQQTLGQYAYVHYNSSRSAPEGDVRNSDSSIDFAGDSGVKDKRGDNAQAPVLSDDMTFDKQVIKQGAILSSSTFNFMMMTFFAFADALQVLDPKMSVNESQNQTATSDTGKKYTQAALENLSAMMSSAIITQSADSGVQSSVVGLKSLDMFYSTSDKQNVFAGPGFVEHQFVADCVAQSTVDVHIEGRVQQLMFVITALTYFQLELTQKITDLVLEQMTNIGNSLDQISVCGNSVGAGLATKIAGFIAKIATVMRDIGVTAVKSITEILAKQGITCTEQGRATHHEMYNEAKHKYGEKNEVFMWPCWGVPSEGLDYSDEHVECGVKDTPVNIALPARKYWTTTSNAWTSMLCSDKSVFGSSMRKGNVNDADNVYANHEGQLPYYQASCYGVVESKKLPADMAKVEGVSSLLPSQAFKNENISASDPVFAATLIHDYVIDKAWNLSMCCTGGLVEWITCKDTKLINGQASNMYVNSSFCGVAATYVVVEVKRGLSKRYMRPWAVTPNALAFNVTGYNSVMDNILYHAFDGISYRIVDLVGSPGLGKQVMSWLYAFQLNDRFKRSNKCPPAVLLGNFEAEPVQYVKSIDKFWTLMTTISREKGLAAGAPGEDKDVIRWSVPVFTEQVSTLPAAVKTLTAVPLVVVDGITGLATDLVSFLSEYKAPLSVDFTIGKNVYRMTEEYICSVTTKLSIDVLEDLVPVLGLKFLGASPTEAYLYSRANRCYYVYTGGTSLTKMDMMERFRNIQKGYWDFVNQEVVMPCLMTFKRLNKHVEDKDSETDNIIVPVMSGSSVSGELPPPVTTIFNDKSWYKAVSLPSGFAWQGPNRVIINRSVFVEYMLDSMKSNFGKWKRLPRERYSTLRKYPELFETVEKDVSGVKGWTHNPFVLVTSPFGVSEETDCLFEWEITFCWPIEMDLLYAPDNMAVVNVMAETMTPGGKVESRPVHVFLTKELFTCNGAYGYYSFRYQSKNGAGNRERLHIWSDSYIAISKLSCEYKTVTSRRSEQLVIQADVQDYKEL